MRIVFWGTPDFANPSLQQLHTSHHQVVAVVSAPDKPAGRGRRLSPPPVRELARQLGYPVLQPGKLRDPVFHDHLRDMAADLFVVVAFRILPAAVISIPSLGAVNLHPSLLPRYRGAAPIQHCLLQGDTETGVTTSTITEQVDAGQILMQRATSIRPQDDFGSLWRRLSLLGAETLLATLDGLESGQLTPRPQPSGPGEAVPEAPKIRPADLVLDWTRSPQKLVNQIRAFSPKPGAYTVARGLRIKLFAARVAQTDSDGRKVSSYQPGEVISTADGLLHIGSADGSIEVAQVQLEGSRVMSVGEFVRGHPLPAGTILG